MATFHPGLESHQKGPAATPTIMRSLVVEIEVMQGMNLLYISHTSLVYAHVHKEGR